MKNVIGTPARGKDFFQRKIEIDKIVKAIDEGANIQLAAPRRVGKTSILMHLLDNQPNANHYLYLDTEAISNSNDFFKKIYSEVIKSNCVSGSVKVMQQIKGAGNSFLKKIKGINVSGTGLELSETEDLDYYNELINLLKGIQLDKGKIILMIDEFPYTISNIIDKTNSNDEAITFLQLNRSLRLDPNINLKIQFIYTGSIGLNTTVENLNATALINDIMSIKVNPIKYKEGVELLNAILEYEKKTITNDNIDFLLKRIEWLTPFYIKLMIKEIIDLMEEDDEEITIELINDSFQEIIDYRNNNYFEHYYSRLRGFFNGNEFDFIIETLSFIVNHNTIKKGDIYNIAVKYKIEKEYRSLIHTLIYDGYIHSEDSGETYRFNSPILKLWWKKYVAN
ncbi:hypothetical protein [Wocania ichthyoenteri]|uniref:hypothetical protein n=1 Tax=Wocania ichthyoenteri TaxID=1230531 RepID=UPI00053D820E|nr:hypothetical protein [Wocania ichthyoenteri]